MSDPTDMRNMPGADAASNSLSAATKSFQGFASEVQRMSKDAIEQTQDAMERLRSAKSVEEVVAIQSSYMQQSFANYTDYTRRFSELMMALPMEFARQGRSAFQQGVDATSKATNEAGEQMKDASRHFDQHHG